MGTRDGIYRRRCNFKRYLCTCFCRSFQGDFDCKHLAACVKHFAAYDAVEAGREYNGVDIPENKRREQYLPAYKAAIDAGIKLVMTSFNTVNGIPATGNQWLMKQVLRDEWGVKGTLIVLFIEQVEWGIAADEQSAADQAIRASVDIDLMTTAYLHQLQGSVKADKTVGKFIDEVVLRILELKNTLGLFENPYRDADSLREATDVFTDENKQVAYDAAIESIVLLKNEANDLPLMAEEAVHFAGPLLESHDLLGAWHWRGDTDETDSILSELTENCPLETAEKTVLFVGEKSEQAGESKLQTQLSLAAKQVTQIEQMAKLYKPIILVVLVGRPLDVSAINDKVCAVLYAYFPGTMGAKAIADLRYGKQDPSAKLTMSLPRSVGQIPIYYNNYNTGRPTKTESEEYVSRYQDTLKTPLYPFGHGLSYTTFEYESCFVSTVSNGINCSV